MALFLIPGLISISVCAQVGEPVSDKVQAQKETGAGTITGRATDAGHNALQGARVELQPRA